MSDFKIFTDSDLFELLSVNDLRLLAEFQNYLYELRSRFNYKPINKISKSEAYQTAWQLNWVDFKEEPITDLYKIDFEERLRDYRILYYSGLVSVAKLKWIRDFNGLIEIPEDHSKLFGKGNKK